MALIKEKKIWVIARDDKELGPYSATEIQQFINMGEVCAYDSIWKKGWDKWKLVGDIPLFSILPNLKAGEKCEITKKDIPDSEKYTSEIKPMLTPDDVKAYRNLKGVHVLGLWLLAGIPGIAAGYAVNAVVQSCKNSSDDDRYIDPKNINRRKEEM